MKLKKVTLLVTALCLVLLFVNTNAFGQEERKIKMDDYQVQLTDWEAREAAASEKLAALNADIDALNGQLNDTQGQIDQTWNDIYAALGTDKAGYEAYQTKLDAIGSEIDGLAALSPEDLFRQREALEAVEAKIAEAKGENLALLTESENKLADLDGKVAALKSKMPANIFDQYTVVNGDYLWKIAKKDDIYGDAMQWIRIYCVNKDQIKDPDLIFPEQIFNIARGVAKDEHLVAKGEFLYKIAGMSKVFNDPTKWTKIYEANKDMIEDPSLIYPYQVLTIPAE